MGKIAPLSAVGALAITSVNVGGAVTFANILAGYDADGSAVSLNVKIGKVLAKYCCRSVERQLGWG